MHACSLLRGTTSQLTIHMVIMTYIKTEKQKTYFPTTDLESDTHPTKRPHHT
jgi:hypothetical protein